MEFTVNAEHVLFGISTLWLGTLTYIWIRHVNEEDRRVSELERRVKEMIVRVEGTLDDIDKYQREFNLKTATDIADIKSSLREILNGQAKGH